MNPKRHFTSAAHSPPLTALRRAIVLVAAALLFPAGSMQAGCDSGAGDAIATKPGPKPPKRKVKEGEKPAPIPVEMPYAFVMDKAAGLQCPPPGVSPREVASKEVTLPLPPFSDGIFPCDACHADMEPKPRRELADAHTEIKLNHGPRERWCYDCHNPKSRNQLRLASGALVDFKESYKLCGQCHGEKLRDWRLGLHGKRYGEWRGLRKGQRCNLLCAHCHDPHAPRFKPIQPLPPPERPAKIQ